MRNFLTLIILLFPVVGIAQARFPELNTIQGTSYKDFDISLIVHTSEDFDQSNLSDNEIDQKIADIIRKQKLKKVADIECPINSNHLKYLGEIHPARTNIFFSNDHYFDTQDTAFMKLIELRGSPLKMHIYKYNNLYIASASNTLLDRYLVYYTIRMYLILQHRFPEIYTTLFVKTQEPPVNFMKGKSLSFVNLTKNYFVSFDGYLSLPSNNAYFGSMQVLYKGPTSLIEEYPNTQVQYFNRQTILNGGAAGTIPIYKTINDPAEKFHMYMRDGFIHSFVHEKIHDWIFQYKNCHPLAQFLREQCQNLGIVRNYYPFEEAVVNNTVNILFEMYPDNGGLSDDILSFYRKEFQLSIDSFKKQGTFSSLHRELQKYNSGNMNRYSLAYSYKLGDPNTIFFIDFFNTNNQPN